MERPPSDQHGISAWIWAPVSVIALHVVDDSFVNPEPGSPASVPASQLQTASRG